MVRWLPVALLAAAAFGGYHLLLRFAAGRIDQLLGAFVLQSVAAAAGAIALGAWWATGATLTVTRAGLGYAALAGLCVGVAEILAFVVFQRGAPVTVATPIIVGGTVALATLGGVVLLREPLSGAQWFGIGLVVVGIGLLSTHSAS